MSVLTVGLCLQELAHGLGELLSYEGNVEEDFYLTFQVKNIKSFYVIHVVLQTDLQKLHSSHLEDTMEY